jgi:type I restriction enzyme S subunit
MRPYLRSANITWKGLDLSDVKEMNFDSADFARFQLEAGDVLLNEGSGSASEVGKPAIWRGEIADCCFQNTLLRVKPLGASSEYLRHYFAFAARSGQFIGETQGVNIFHIGKDGLAKFPVPVAPLAEQRRIVAKLDALTARTARARADLDRIPALAARYKQAVLAKAFSGELTTDFHGGRHVADGPREYEELGLDDQERGIWSVVSLPAGWAWHSFTSIFDDVTDSRRKLPTKEYRHSGRFPIVDQGEVAVPGFTDREDMLNASAPPNIVFGDHTRCVKFVSERFVQGADGVKVLKPRLAVDARYAELLLRAVEIPAKGYSRHMKFLRASYFPVCGLTVQREIVRRVDRALAEIDRLTAEALAARRLLDRLDQAVLAKAFRGELVPQDPADEPAGVLLDRIRAERAAAPKVKRGRKAA